MASKKKKKTTLLDIGRGKSEKKKKTTLLDVGREKPKKKEKKFLPSGTPKPVKSKKITTSAGDPVYDDNTGFFAKKMLKEDG